MNVVPELRSIFADTGLGLARGEVRLVPGDPAWPVTFERVRARLRAVLPATVVAVEHVGSTAVPGLPAKPILDIALGVRQAADPAPITAALEEQGLIFRDHLRENAAAREEYAALKARLAAAVGHDRKAYVAGKSGFIARRAQSDGSADSARS